MKKNLGLITALLMTLPYGSFPASPNTPPQTQEEKTRRLTKAEKKRDRKLERNRRIYNES